MGKVEKVIRHAIETYPHIISNNTVSDTVSENIHYTPPEEFVAPEQVVYGVDQVIGALQNRTETQTGLEDQKRSLRKRYEISSDRTRPFEEKIEAMLELDCEHFGLDLDALTHLPAHDDGYEIAD